MNLLALVLISLLASTYAAVPPSQTAIPMSTTFSLNTFQWKDRLLLVFAPDATDADYRSQLRLLEQQQSELADRNLLLIPVLGKGESTVQGQPIDPATATQLRNQFGVQPSEFCVILVGKDGTEKRRDSQPVPPSALYSQIDAMPMRQREMQEK